MEYNTIVEPSEEQRKLNDKAIRSLVFGILSVVISKIPGLVLGILALTQSRSASSYAAQNGLLTDGKVKAGRILGIVGICISVLAICWGAVKATGFVAALITSIRTGSLGLLGDYFQELGESLRRLIP